MLHIVKLDCCQLLAFGAANTLFLALINGITLHLKPPQPHHFVTWELTSKHLSDRWPHSLQIRFHGFSIIGNTYRIMSVDELIAVTLRFLLPVRLSSKRQISEHSDMGCSIERFDWLSYDWPCEVKTTIWYADDVTGSARDWTTSKTTIV